MSSSVSPRKKTKRPPIPLDEAFAKRFWQKVERSGRCWLWQGGRSAGRNKKWGWLAYGVVGIRRPPYHYNEYAHRVSWVLTSGKQIPVDRHVLHKRECSSKLCVKPSHLYLGTHSDNMADFRSTFPDGYRFAAKLTVDQVRKIKALLLAGKTRKDVASEFGVTYYCIKDIHLGKSWSNIT